MADQINCAQCGRQVSGGIAHCPYCRKNPHPKSEPASTEGKKIIKFVSKGTRRWRFVPKDQPKEETGKEKEKQPRQPVETSRVIESLTMGPDAERIRAIDEVLGNGGYSAKDFIAAFENENLPGREHIAKLLGRLGERSALPALIKGLGSADRTVSMASGWAIGRIGDSKAVPHILEQLKTTDAQKRQFFAYITGTLVDPAATPELARLLRDLEPGVRIQTLLSLSSIEGRQNVSTLQAALNDPHALVQAAAKELLRIFGYKSRSKQIMAAILVGLAALAALAVTIAIF